MMDDPILEQMEALLETARREAYERGYADAMRRVMEAAGHAQAGTAPDWRGMAGPWHYGPRRQRAQRGSIEVGCGDPRQHARRAQHGRDRELQRGDNEPLKTASIHVTLRRLEQAGRVTRDGRRWRLTAAEQRDELSEDTTGEDPATEPQVLVAPETSPDTMYRRTA